MNYRLLIIVLFVSVNSVFAQSFKLERSAYYYRDNGIWYKADSINYFHSGNKKTNSINTFMYDYGLLKVSPDFHTVGSQPLRIMGIENMEVVGESNYDSALNMNAGVLGDTVYVKYVKNYDNSNKLKAFYHIYYYPTYDSIFKVLFTYSNGLLSKEEYYYYGNLSWKLINQKNIFYNNNNEVETIVFMEDLSGAGLDTFYCLKYTYLSNVVNQAYIYYYGGALPNLSLNDSALCEYGYTNNLISSIISKRYDVPSSSWVFQDTIQSIYRDISNKITKIEDSYDECIYEFFYNSDGILYKTTENYGNGLSDPAGISYYYTSLITGINEIKNIQSITTFPNPATNLITLNINTTSNAIVELRVINPFGQMISIQDYKLQQGNNTFKYDGSILSSGVYKFIYYVNGQFYKTESIAFIK